MDQRIDQTLSAITKAPVAIPVIGASVFGSLTASQITQVAAATAAVLYALIQLVTLYRGIVAAKRERADYKKGQAQ